MSENIENSGADIQAENLNEIEFHKILDCTIEELLEKAWTEHWKIKHIEFWLKVKNAQNFEYLINGIRDRLDAMDRQVIL